MLNSVNSGIKQVILHNKIAYDMWKTLEQMYGRRHDILRTYQISSQIFKLEQGSMSVTNYFATLKGLWDEFDYYRMENWSSIGDHCRWNQSHCCWQRFHKTYRSFFPILCTSRSRDQADDWDFREVGGLYYYQLETTSALKSAAKCLGTKHQEILLWHSRLGHLHKQEPTIDRLVESDALALDPVKQLSSSVESTAPLNMNELNLPVAIRKDVRSCTQHPISNHVSYSRLSPSYHAFVSQLSNHAIPSSYYEATRKLGSWPASTPIEVNHDLTSSSGEDLTSLEKGTYQRLVGKLLYLSMTRPDITYAISVVSQYMHAPKTIHMKAVDRILRCFGSTSEISDLSPPSDAHPN
ncbi:hypothetical protein ZIOFF_034294 [Zingiber officinale]|uniref:Uncharacterized protein n=1 Tax=Zingiber officinale TaxID=94328 RepID=A0A8J5LDD1_ZINOF|nr:hypothetical protein ZIOFF_034294 [Zingiber officinale]